MNSVADSRTFNIFLKCCMVAAPLMFAAAMVALVPQQEALKEAVGNGEAFLTSLKDESAAWTNAHVLMLVGAFLYIPAATAYSRIFVARNALTGLTIGVIFMIGVTGIIGQLALDFAYGVLSCQDDLAAMQAIRSEIMSDTTVNILFYQAANASFVAGMALYAFTSIATGWAPRLSGIFIILGWAAIIALHGTFAYAEALGHLLIAVGFGVASTRLADAGA